MSYLLAHLDWPLGVLSILAVYLQGQRRWYGWALMLFNQSLWLTLIFTRELYGLLPVTLTLTFLAYRNMRIWRNAAIRKD